MSKTRKHYAFPRRRGDNITLIGMPGSGKSTLGYVTAKELGRPFIDTDKVLCEMTGTSGTGELSAKTDFDGFVRAEEKAVRSVEVTGHIIATGGSVIYSPRAMRHLQKLGSIIYIQVPPDIIEMRVGSAAERGVILAPGQTMDDLYKTRHRLYHRYADIEFIPGELNVRTSGKLLAAMIEYIERERKRYEKEAHRSY